MRTCTVQRRGGGGGGDGDGTGYVEVAAVVEARRTHIHAQTHTRTHAHTHTRMHAHTHARTHAHTHTHPPLFCTDKMNCENLPNNPPAATQVHR